MPRPAGTPREVLVWCALRLVLCYTQAEVTLSGPQLQVGVQVGLQEYQVLHDGTLRRYLLYVPTDYNPQKPVPLWILAHGTGDTPEFFINMTGLITKAENHTFALAVLQAVQGVFNVGLDAQPDNPAGPDDVSYTRIVLQKVAQKLNVDMHRIRCAGFSRGARFCSRLASELSSFITGIAVVSGVRFPKPNNATRPMPVISFHGTEDTVNPIDGNGYPYWKTSVADAMRRWADFNGCTRQSWERVSMHVVKSMHTGCTDDADVVLLLISGGGHTWPGSHLKSGKLGYVTQEISATETLRRFFFAHPMPTRCQNALVGDPCYIAVRWAMTVGIYTNPEWYGGLTNLSSFEAFQETLHRRIEANCPMPCQTGTTPGLLKTKTVGVYMKNEQHAVMIEIFGDISRSVLGVVGGMACIALAMAVALTVTTLCASRRATSRTLGAHFNGGPELPWGGGSFSGESTTSSNGFHQNLDAELVDLPSVRRSEAGLAEPLSAFFSGTGTHWRPRDYPE